MALPALFDEAGTVSPLRAEAYLTAALTRTSSTEIAEVLGYSNRPGQLAQHRVSSGERMGHGPCLPTPG
ncbi:hypothetical protein ABT071_21575 [Streptomyces sp. NPDC002506]|uniref:hypothetical protein n=1 Tax=Streptomyces sp. NPDC002506 TaxID=3154536 RepID=UPI003320BAAB